jgi:hypothetical protein
LVVVEVAMTVYGMGDKSVVGKAEKLVDLKE